MTTHKNHHEGTFSWADLATTNLGKAIEFYGSLFGWSIQINPPNDETSMEYAMCSLDGKFVCGLGELSEEMKNQGIPPVWTTYIDTKNVDAWVAKAKELGAEVQVPAMDIGEFGRMAYLQGPTGEVFGLWQAKMHTGAQVTGEPGSICWNELATQDAAKSLIFYNGLCNWDGEVKEMGSTEYTHLYLGETPDQCKNNVGGIIQMTKEWGDTPSHWMVYFAVQDCDKSAKNIEQLGGKVCVPPTDIPNVGRFSVVQDNTDATFSIIQLSE